MLRLRMPGVCACAYLTSVNQALAMAHRIVLQSNVILLNMDLINKG